MCSVVLPKRPDSYRTITRGASRGGARCRDDNNHRRQEALLNGDAVTHKSWEKHAWQNCHDSTLYPENMSRSNLHPLQLFSPLCCILSRAIPSCTCTSLPCLVPFAAFGYFLKLPEPSRHFKVFLQDVELRRRRSLPFMRFFMRLLLYLLFNRSSASKIDEMSFSR